MAKDIYDRPPAPMRLQYFDAMGSYDFDRIDEDDLAKHAALCDGIVLAMPHTRRSILLDKKLVILTLHEELQ